MDALELLKQDHQKVKELFKQGQQTEDKQQQKANFQGDQIRIRNPRAHRGDDFLSCNGRARRTKGHGA